MIACRQPSTVQSQLLPGCHQIHSFSGFMSFCFQVNILSGFPQVKTIVRPWAQTEPVNIYTCVYNTYIYIYTHNIHIIFSYLQTYSLSLVYMYICFDVHIHLQRIEIHTACLHFIIFDTISYNFFFLYLFNPKWHTKFPWNKGSNGNAFRFPAMNFAWYAWNDDALSVSA